MIKPTDQPGAPPFNWRQFVTPTFLIVDIIIIIVVKFITILISLALIQALGPLSDGSKMVNVPNTAVKPFVYLVEYATTTHFHDGEEDKITWHPG